MKATEISYRRVKSLVQKKGDPYETETLEMTVQLDEGESATEAFEILKANVECLLDVEATQP